jgi:hypothetical protein
MAWTYADYEGSAYSAAQRLSRLKDHIAEVSAAIGPDIVADGKSRGSGSLVQYLQMLKDRLNELEQGPGNATAGGVSRFRIGKRLV